VLSVINWISLYAGSVNAGNATDLGKPHTKHILRRRFTILTMVLLYLTAKEGDVDGFLVGGASLKPEFITIVNARI